MNYDDILAELAAGTAAGSLPAWARRVLDEIDAGASTVAAVRHPLGFLCLPVERTGDLGVCLHIWTPEVRAAENTTSPVHCHSWDLVSFVLYGTVRNSRVAVEEAALAPGALAATHRIFEVASGPDGDELRATPRTVRYAAGAGGSSLHRTGDTYTLPAGVFHSTRIENGLDAATVALGRHTPGGGDLSLGPLDAPTHHTDRQRCDPDETARAARRSARLLAAAHPRRPHRPGAPDPCDGPGAFGEPSPLDEPSALGEPGAFGEPGAHGERAEPCANRTT